MTDKLLDKTRYWSTHEEVPFALQRTFVALIARLEAAEKVCESSVPLANEENPSPEQWRTYAAAMSAWHAARDAGEGT